MLRRRDRDIEQAGLQGRHEDLPLSAATFEPSVHRRCEPFSVMVPMGWLQLPLLHQGVFDLPV
jgi:hypothetical protein